MSSGSNAPQIKFFTCRPAVVSKQPIALMSKSGGLAIRKKTSTLANQLGVVEGSVVEIFEILVSLHPLFHATGLTYPHFNLSPVVLSAEIGKMTALFSTSHALPFHLDGAMVAYGCHEPK